MESYKVQEVTRCQGSFPRLQKLYNAEERKENSPGQPCHLWVVLQDA